jgi:hypothetical protein
MFYGFILLAKKFRDNDIPIEKISDILDGIDFSRDNDLWKEISVLDDKGNVKGNPKGRIRKYFNELNVGEVRTSA